MFGIRNWKDFKRFFERVCKYGIKYSFSQKFRKKCRKKEQRKRYGNYRSKSKHRKHQLFRRDGNRCFWCNGKMIWKTATIDHIVPVSVKKDNSLANMRLIHDDCRVVRDRFIAKGILS